jgi:hypothetical protein
MCRRYPTCLPARNDSRKCSSILLEGKYQVRPSAFNDSRILRTLQNFAAQAVIAIENVRLFDEIQDKNRQVADASQNKSQFLSSMSHNCGRRSMASSGSQK